MHFKKSLCNITLALSLSFGGVLGNGCSMPQTMTDYYQNHAKYENTKYSAAILVANPHKIENFMLKQVLWIYELRLASALKKEFNVDSYYIKMDATKKDLEDVLLDDKFKIVVVAGHGDNRDWLANDTEVSEYDLDLFVSQHPEISKDWFIRHTCGEKQEEQMIIPPEAREHLINEIKKAGGSVHLIGDNFIEYEVNELDKIRIDEKIAQSKVKSKIYFGSIVVNKTGHVLGWEELTTPTYFLISPFHGKTD